MEQGQSESEGEREGESTSKILKYQHKIKKFRKKLAKAEMIADSNKNSSDAQNQVQLLNQKLKIYEKKYTNIQKLFKDQQIDREQKPNTDNNNTSSRSNTTSLLLFYCYVEPAWTKNRHLEILKWVEELLTSLHVTGRLRVSREGFNGTLTGPYDSLRAFGTSLRAIDPSFQNLRDHDDLKYTDNLPIGQAFRQLKVFAVNELVNYGFGIDSAPTVKHGGVHLQPREFHEKLKEDNVVVVDVRNSYEAEIGRFCPTNGEYIDPQMRISTEFPAWARENVEKLKDKQVLMYCTGGIRCERASAYLRSLGHSNVYQLQGGIHHYLDTFAPEGGGLWAGENYTFDKRFSHGATQVNEAESVLSRCAACEIPWNRYRGKRRCPNCGVPLLLCSECLQIVEENNESNPKLQNVKVAVCTLCKQGKKFDKKEHFDEVKKRKLEEAVEKKAPQRLVAGVIAATTCGLCGESFKSRNALFRHIKETGHANRKAKIIH